MITIDIEFYHRIENHLVDEKRISLPEDIIFSAAQSTDIHYINARPFEVTEDIKKHSIQMYPELAEKFRKYDAYFIGWIGLKTK